MAFWRILSETYVFLKGLTRYKETLFWIIIFPILFYSIMAGIWGTSNPPSMKLGIYNGDSLAGTYNVSKALLRALNSSRLFKTKLYTNLTKLKLDVMHGKIDAGLSLPGNFSELISSGTSPTLTIYYVESKWGGFVQETLMSFLRTFSDSIRTRAIDLSLGYITSLNISNTTRSMITKWMKFIEEPIHINVSIKKPPLIASSHGLKAYYAISMIGLEALFIGLFSGVEAVNERKRTGTLGVILSSPMKGWEMLVSDTVSVLVAVGVSAISVILFSILTGARYVAPPTTFVVVTILLTFGTLSMVGLGLLLAPLAKTPEGATVIANAIAFPLMFIGGVAIPPFMLPKYLRTFANNWPLGKAINAVRASLLYDMPPLKALNIGLESMIASAIIYILGAFIYERLLARVVERY